MTSKKIKLSENRSNRNFQECWTNQYGVIERNSKALCILCDEHVVSRTWNVKRHCETNHKWLLEKSDEERQEFIMQELRKKTAQSKNLLRYVCGHSDLVSASFSLSHSIVKRGKPFSDGEFLKSAFVDCAPYLFDGFKNKDAIIKRIKELPISRNTVKNRVMDMGSNIASQIGKDLAGCDFFSICLDETTDITSSARLAIFARYFSGHKMYEELLSLETLSSNTTGKALCDIVVNMLRERNIDMSKIVSVTTDGAPNMIGRHVGFVKLFTEVVGHPILPFHCIIHQEVLCAKVGLKKLNDVTSVVTKVVNLISARALHKREFSLLLNEVQSAYNGLLMYNNVRWLSRGKVLERFVECLNEIKLFLSMKNNRDFPELDDAAWLSRLMFFTDLSVHLNELNVKLQGYGKSIDIMFGFIIAFESKLNIFQRDLETKSYKYFPRLQKNSEKLSEEDQGIMNTEETFFSSVLSSLRDQFSSRFAQFRELEEILLCMKYPDRANFTKLKIDLFEWLNIDNLEMELVEFQSSSIWKQKFINLSADLEERERDRLHGSGSCNQDEELLFAWNSIPETFCALKKIVKAMLTVFSSTYACETLFSSLNHIKNEKRNRLTDDVSSACVMIKNTNYKPKIKGLAGGAASPKEIDK